MVTAGFHLARYLFGAFTVRNAGAPFHGGLAFSFLEDLLPQWHISRPSKNGHFAILLCGNIAKAPGISWSSPPTKHSAES